jgi:predicted ATP-grasp superfamily ATP-dependent carboligase
MAFVILAITVRKFGYMDIRGVIPVCHLLREKLATNVIILFAKKANIMTF